MNRSKLTSTAHTRSTGNVLRLILVLVAATLATAACANPVGSSAEQQKAPRASHDQSASGGGNMMGGSS